MRNSFRFFQRLCICSLITGVVPVLSTLASPENYVERWSGFQSKLIRKEKSFQEAASLETWRDPYQLVEYVSDGMKLQALLDTRNINPTTRKPVVVYLHGGFALRYSELKITQPFADAGYIVFAPSWRGENSNPGYFECFFGEVRDAKAAIHWLADQDFVDRKKIYLFGWSVGGGIALNLALHDDIPIRLSGSSAGLYDLDLIKSWAIEDDFIKFPYDYQDERENFFRLPLYHLQDMVRPHNVYIGAEDDYELFRKTYNELYPEDNTHIRLMKLQGNHVDSVPLAVREFIGVISDHP